MAAPDLSSSSESSSSSKASFLKREWDEFKAFWAERVSFLDKVAVFNNPDGPLPSWSDSDVQEFIASDPAHGNTLKTVRESSKFVAAGSLLGAVSLAGVSYKYSRSLHGSALAFLAGGFFGAGFGGEVANHWFQLYRLDISEAYGKYGEWWKKKSSSRSGW